MWHTAQCATCGIAFAMTEEFYRARDNDGKAFYCPNGHELVYRPSKAELERQVEQLKRARAQWEQIAKENAAGHREALGLLTTEKRRSAAYRQHFERVKAEKAVGGADWREHFSVWGMDYIERALDHARSGVVLRYRENELLHFFRVIEQMYSLLRDAEDRGVRWPVPGSGDDG